MFLLVCNVGSTSLKFKLFNMPSAEVAAESKVERVGNIEDAIFHYKNLKNGFAIRLSGQSIPSYTDGIRKFLSHLVDEENGVLENVEMIERVGFKTVLARGFYGVHQLDEPVLAAMREYLSIAPVHNSCYLEAIAEFRMLLPDTPLIGVFETGFHMTVPKERRMYGIPYEWYERYGIERFGYHGASHGYVAEKIADAYGVDQKVISCHLGGSCSLCAIRDGRSIDNSFGFSLQTGVIHANRVGDIDAYVIPFLMDRGMSMEEILTGLDKNGGLNGISGVSGDLRYVTEAAENGNYRANLAIEMFVDGIVRYLGSYHAFLGGLDHLVFTGGIGENDCKIRRDVCGRVSHLGIVLDEKANEICSRTGIISTADSKVTVHVISADEEIIVARKTYEYIPEGKY
jgi:acetate kinase